MRLFFGKLTLVCHIHENHAFLVTQSFSLHIQLKLKLAGVLVLDHNLFKLNSCHSQGLSEKIRGKFGAFFWCCGQGSSLSLR